MERFINEPKLYDVYKDLIMRTAKACINVQVRGALVDRPYVDELNSSITKEIKKYEKQLREMKCVREYEKFKQKRMNLNSDDQVRELLYDKKFLGLKSEKTTRKGAKKSVDVHVKKKFAKEGVKFCEVILKYDDFMHQKSNSVDGLKGVIYPDSLLHAQFSNAFTRTGRLSCRDPNMENFPKRKNKHLRGVIIPPKGYVILSADYKQLEAVCIGITSGDKNFKDAIAGGYDIHYEKALEIRGKKRAKEMRSMIKNQFVFPVIYGAAAPSVARNLDISETKAQKHIDKMWKDFPRIREWQLEQVDFYNKNLYVETRTGRRREGPLVSTQIFNTPSQGLAAEFCELSMCNLTEREYWVFNNVHDELDFYIQEKNVERDAVRIKRAMTTLPEAWVDDVQVEVEIQIGYNWADLETITV